MNIKTMAIIIMVLVIGAIAIQLFVPKHVDGAGKVSLFGKDSETKKVEA